MLTMFTRMRMLFVGLVLALAASSALASGLPGSQATATSRPDLPPVEKQPAGSPEMGILVIIGVVAFLVLIAWIVAHIGDDSRSSGESSLV